MIQIVFFYFQFYKKLIFLPVPANAKKSMSVLLATASKTAEVLVMFKIAVATYGYEAPSMMFLFRLSHITCLTPLVDALSMKHASIMIASLLL